MLHDEDDMINDYLNNVSISSMCDNAKICYTGLLIV